MVGNEVFFISFKKKKVEKGYVYNATINQLGYITYNVVSNGLKISVDENLVFETENEAKVSMDKLLPIAEEMDNVRKKADSVLDNLRIKIVGNPKYLDEAREIYK